MSYWSATLLKKVVLCWALMPLITGYNNPPSQSPQVIAPHCSDRCGNVSIPYPFGIEEGCYYEEHKNNRTRSNFKVHCNRNTSSPVPYFGRNLYVRNISVTEGELLSNFSASYICYNQSGYVDDLWNSLNLATFTLSSEKNVLVAIGCDTYAWFLGLRTGMNYSTGCMTNCVQAADVTDSECSGVGCCQASIPTGVFNITVETGSYLNHSRVYDFNPCSVAFPVAKDAFRFYRRNLSLGPADFRLHYEGKMLPVVYSWVIGQKNCSAAKADRSCLCQENAECLDQEYESGYRCKCKHGFSGNPYLPRGCTDIDECKEANNDCEKPEYCKNINGGHICECPTGYHGNGTKTDHCISDRPWFIPVLTTAGAGGGIIIFLVTGFVFHYRKYGERQLRKMRESFFRQNGGLLLHEKLSARNVDTLKIFSAKDLEIASNNYSKENVIGKGGFGIVYKGVLRNNQVVAIKKSLKVDPNQMEQFINEVLVLSQIKNKYVVKLLGCCLESEVPLLVYEFISNGTLYDHLHDATKASYLKWPLRLDIASEVANVLSYLHNTISTPIIHRDMKSMNILLDENYTAKVTDFGASRLVPLEESPIATIVLGTWGYLDPEYMQTSELTEKSDVYSFGVVLVELLTSRTVISNLRPETEKCLSMHFLVQMEQGQLLHILDKNIVSEGTIGQIQQVANLAKWCLMLKGDERPTMKEVAVELENIKRKGSHPWNDDGSAPEDCESFLIEVSRLDDGGCSSGIGSNS